MEVSCLQAKRTFLDQPYKLGEKVRATLSDAVVKCQGEDHLTKPFRHCIVSQTSRQTTKMYIWQLQWYIAELEKHGDTSEAQRLRSDNEDQVNYLTS